MNRYTVSGTIPAIGIRYHVSLAETADQAIKRFNRAYRGAAIGVHVIDTLPRLDEAQRSRALAWAGTTKTTARRRVK